MMPAASGRTISPRSWKKSPLTDQPKCSTTSRLIAYTRRCRRFQFLLHARLPPVKRGYREKAQDGKADDAHDDIRLFNDCLADQSKVQAIVQAEKDRQVDGGVHITVQAQRTPHTDNLRAAEQGEQRRTGQREHQQGEGDVPGADLGLLDGVDRQVVLEKIIDQYGQRNPRADVGE